MKKIILIVGVLLLVNCFLLSDALAVTQEEAVEIAKAQLSWQLQVPKEEIILVDAIWFYGWGDWGIGYSAYNNITLYFDTYYECQVYESGEVKLPPVYAGVLIYNGTIESGDDVLVSNDYSYVITRLPDMGMFHAYLGKKVKVTYPDPDEIYEEEKEKGEEYTIEEFPYYAPNIKEYEIPLYEGWNLIGIPVWIPGFTISNLRREIRIDRELIVAAVKGGYVTLDPNAVITPGTAVFVKCSSDYAITIRGKEVTGALDMQLVVGWNGVCLPNERIAENGDITQTFPYEALNAINIQGGKAKAIYVVEPGGEQINWIKVAGVDGGEEELPPPEDYPLEPTRGCLILCESESLYTPSIMPKGEVYTGYGINNVKPESLVEMPAQ